MSAANGLTTEERRAIRLNLIDQGFQRGPAFNYDADTHLDKGDGAYTEEWYGPGNTRITLTWTAKRILGSESA